MNTRENLEKLIIEKAIKDSDFRTALLHNPRETIAKEIGIKIPDTIDIRILKELPGNFYLVLPEPVRKSGETELTERELMQVAGGQDWQEVLTDWICMTNGC